MNKVYPPRKKTASLHLQIDDFWKTMPSNFWEQVRLLFVSGALYQSRLMYNAPFFWKSYCFKNFWLLNHRVFFKYPIYCYTIYFWITDYTHRIHGTGILVGSATGYEIILGTRGWAKNMNNLLQNVYENMWATKNTLTTFHYTVCLIGILIMVYYNVYITGEYNALYTPTNHVFFHCSCKRTVISFKKCGSWFDWTLKLALYSWHP